MFLTAVGEAFKHLHVPPLGRVELVAWIQRTSQRTAVTWAAAAKVEVLVKSYNGIEAALNPDHDQPRGAATETLRIMTPFPGASLRPPVSVHLSVDLHLASQEKLRRRVVAEPDAWMACYAAADRKHCLKIRDGNTQPMLGEGVTLRHFTVLGHPAPV